MKKNNSKWAAPLFGGFGVFFGILLLCSPYGVGLSESYGYAPSEMPPDVQSALKQIDDSDDISVVMSAAEILVEEGRSTGNAEIVEVADTSLALLPNSNSNAAVLKLRAIAAQYLHKFDEALTLLNIALSINGRDPSAHLTRANILLVQGKLREAQKACLSLAKAQRYDLYVLCDTTAKALGPESTAAAERLNSMLVRGRMDPALRGYAFSVLGEIAMFEGDYQKAHRLLQQAQSADPENLRIRMLHADSLLNLNQPIEALEVLNVAADIDAFLVRRAIAFKRSGKRRTLANASKEIENRIQTNRLAGHAGHAREEALYFLEVKNDYANALERANVNWQFQREFEDARLLIDAAIAADSIKDADKVRQWMRNENITAPELTTRLILDEPKN